MTPHSPSQTGNQTAVTLVTLGVSLVPALLALLPLTLNGVQQVLGALGRTSAPEGASLGSGAVMLTAAALPFLAGITAVGIGRARRLEWRRTWEACAASAFVTGLAACCVAMVFAAI